MKKTVIYIMAAVVAIAAVSCNKIENEQASNVKTVTAGFDQETRTSLSGTSVSWEIGDVIKVMNEKDGFEIHTIAEGNLNNGKVTFTTSLTGQLYAIYGDSGATVPAADQISFTIPSSQSGDFKDANICVAKLDANNHFAFKNATAVLHFTNLPTATSGKVANSVTVKGISSANIFGSATASFSGESVNVSCSGSNSAIFSINQGILDMAEAYYAVAPATISVIAETFNKKTSTIKSSAAVVRNKIYTTNVSAEFNLTVQQHYRM